MAIQPSVAGRVSARRGTSSAPSASAAGAKPRITLLPSGGILPAVPMAPTAQTRASKILRPELGPTNAEVKLGAPPAFETQFGRAVYVDLKSVDATMTFDVQAHRTLCKARVTFDQLDQGCPVIDLVPGVSAITVDGVGLDAAKYARVKQPVETRVLGKELAPGEHTVEVEYEIKGEHAVRFDERGAQFFQFLSDLQPLRYSEFFQPSNLEYDKYAMTLTLQQKGGTRANDVLTNGTVKKNADGSQTITFPSDFNTASFYVNMVDPSIVKIERGTYESIDGRKIPLTTYAKTAQMAKDGMDEVLRAIEEDEERWGPFPHDSFLGGLRAASDTEWHDGSMEYTGATIGEVDAQNHELFHQYWGRGIAPKDGNAGWIDEAVNTWHDNGYPRSRSIDLEGRYPRLSGFSPYRRETPIASYQSGGGLMEDLDKALEDGGGLQPVLLKFVKTKLAGDRLYTTDDFEKFITDHASPANKELITKLFTVKVYAGDRDGGRDEPLTPSGIAFGGVNPLEAIFDAIRNAKRRRSA